MEVKFTSSIFDNSVLRRHRKGVLFVLNFDDIKAATEVINDDNDATKMLTM